MKFKDYRIIEELAQKIANNDFVGALDFYCYNDIVLSYGCYKVATYIGDLIHYYVMKQKEKELENIIKGDNKK